MTLLDRTKATGSRKSFLLRDKREEKSLAILDEKKDREGVDRTSPRMIDVSSANS